MKAESAPAMSVGAVERDPAAEARVAGVCDLMTPHEGAGDAVCMSSPPRGQCSPAVLLCSLCHAAIPSDRISTRSFSLLTSITFYLNESLSDSPSHPPPPSSLPHCEGSAVLLSH